MKTISDRVLAARLLRARQEGGYRLGTFVRLNAKRYVLIAAFYGLALVLEAAIGFWIGFAFLLGLLLGTLLQDLNWVRASQRTWPFNMKVIDWVLVEELAAEEPPA